MVWIFISFLTEKDPISEFNNFMMARFACQRFRPNLAQGPFLSTPYVPTRDTIRVHFFHHQIEDELPNVGVKTSSAERISPQQHWGPSVQLNLCFP